MDAHTSKADDRLHPTRTKTLAHLKQSSYNTFIRKTKRTGFDSSEVYRRTHRQNHSDDRLSGFFASAPGDPEFWRKSLGDHAGRRKPRRLPMTPVCQPAWFTHPFDSGWVVQNPRYRSTTMTYLNLVPSAHISTLTTSFTQRLHTDWQAHLRRRMALDDLIETHEDTELAQPESVATETHYHHAA